MRDALGRGVVSERRACRVLGQSRSTQRRTPHVPDDEARLVKRMIELATEYGRYGYRRITMMLREEGWLVNPKRVYRLWRPEGLKVPQRKPKRRWLNDGSCIRFRPECRNHVWSYDFVFYRTHDGRRLRMLTLTDEFTRECLVIESPCRRCSRSPASLDRLLVALTVSQERWLGLLAFGGSDLADPDVAEADGVTVVLQADRQSVGVLFVLRRASERRVAFQFEVVENQDAVVDRRDVGR